MTAHPEVFDGALAQEQAQQQADPDLRAAQERRLRRVWSVPPGWRYWSEVNNDTVGLWYITMAFGFFVFAGLLGLLIRVQLFVPENDFLSAELYNQVFTLHGSAMMFLFAVPIFEAIAVLLTPQIMGTRDLPFPRLSAYGFWCFAVGGVFVAGSILFGAAPAGGWFMYPPLTTQYQDGIGPDVWLLGLSFIEISSIAAAVELIVGILRCRPPGMKIHLMPLYGWYLLVGCGMILFAFPPLIAGDLLFEMERAFDWPFFDPERGGDPMLWQHLFWIFGHPEVYIVFLPAVALVAIIVPTFARRPMIGYSWVVLAAVGIGFISFGLWVHHMFTTGLPGLSLGFFSAASEAVAIPTAIQIFCFIATIWAGRFKPSVPMLFMAGALAIFVLGGLTGVMVALAPFDFAVHDTYFIVAHLHYVLVGGMLFPVIGAVYYFFPLTRGVWLEPRLGKIAFWTMFVGFHVAFLPMHATGLAGMPRRVYTYSEASGFGLLNAISTVGAFIFAAGVAVFLFDVLVPWRRQRRRSPDDKGMQNPWGSGALEWLPALPVDPWAPRSIPHVTTRYPLWQQDKLSDEVNTGHHYLPDAEEAERETLVTSAIDAAGGYCQRIAGPTFVPMIAALLTGGFFIFGAWHWWTASLASAGGAFAMILYWCWTGLGRWPEKPDKHIGRGRVMKLYASGSESVGWWALLIAMLADSTAFVSLLFAWFFFWTVHPDFPLPADPALSQGLMTGLALAGLAWVFSRLAVARNARRTTGGDWLWSLAAAVTGACAVAALWSGPSRAGLDPTAHVYPAMVWVLCGWTAVHVALGAVINLYAAARSVAGKLHATRDAELRIALLYQHFMLPTVATLLAVLVGFPLVAGGSS